MLGYPTRQLPIGAGHCQWGGLTDRNICNIHGDAHLASRSRDASAMGLLHILAPCQLYW